MMKRSLTRVTALAAALLALGGVGAGTAQAAEAPACAKEQLAFLEAEDKATTADNNADAARTKLDQANNDQKKLEQTADTLRDTARSVEELFELLMMKTEVLTQADADDANAINKAEFEMYDKVKASDAAGVADIADKAAAAAERILKKTPEDYKNSVSFDNAQGWTERLKTSAGEARKATTAKDRTTLAQNVTTASTDARTAHDAVPPARTDLKTCLQKATA
nr:hypothetical protein OG284_36205 [Streptomyces sp. NBC_01177]